MRGDRRERTTLEPLSSEPRFGGGAPFDRHVLASEHWMWRCTRESPSPSLRATLSSTPRRRSGAAFRK
ncbi:MAG: hypothetical protein AVDCRST_MAG89-2655 [uncultured Gemmatimonadetes bacterium]|uniref:Uncharacterized protein n=1 Tax=uncultured Gemmatimonadota bacterium TaxID=203437 RepID=A0A6J4LVC3_9BACT|nr:MAG: hypothetical protein AVDCRST_MAG89-2655 [uncultured Gemmatimonadota bacterium]